MKRFFAALALIALGSAASADPVDGVWQTEVDDGAYAYVTMGPCNGDKICGIISRTFNADGEYQSENIGKAIVINMVSNGDGSYEGNVWRPSNDRIYIGKMELSGNQLVLRGCVAGGLLCAAQNWVRIQ